METLLNIGIGILGVIFYVLFTSRTQIAQKDFVLSEHLKTNKNRWLWTISIIVTIAVLLQIEPSLIDSIKSFTGVDFNATRASYFSLAIALAALIRGEVNKNK